MSRSKSNFRQRDVTRAVKAVRAAKLDVARVEIEGTKVVIIVGAAEPVNSWDEPNPLLALLRARKKPEKKKTDREALMEATDEAMARHRAKELSKISDQQYEKLREGLAKRGETVSIGYRKGWACKRCGAKPQPPDYAFVWGPTYDERQMRTPWCTDCMDKHHPGWHVGTLISELKP